MKHLNTENLLLVADGDGAVEAEAHLDACAACRAALGELQGTLTAATTELRARTEDESAEAHAAAWARLAPALTPEAHLEPRELLLYCEDELSGDRTAHLEHCAQCHDELLRAQAFLAEVEHELRATVETEPAARRAAALAALEARLRPAAAKVVEFPMRWSRAYAAAAALAFATAGGFLYTQIVNAPQPQTATVAVAAAPALNNPALNNPALNNPALDNPTLNNPAPDAPAPSAEPAENPIQASLESSPVNVAPAPAAEPEPQRFRLALAPADTAARSTSTGSERAPLVGAVRNSKALEPAWTLEAPAEPAQPVREIAASLAPAETIVVGDRVVGGLVRTALVEHYEDAARRSFLTPEPTAIEGELARFVSGVYRSQSELLKHAYELNRLASSGAGRSAVLTHLRRALEHERAIYDGLSETLPRRFWTAGGRAAVEPLGDPAAEAQALLSDALALEETLTAMFNRSSDSFDVRENVSSGRLLERIDARLKNLRAALRSL